MLAMMVLKYSIRQFAGNFEYYFLENVTRYLAFLPWTWSLMLIQLLASPLFVLMCFQIEPDLTCLGCNVWTLYIGALVLILSAVCSWFLTSNREKPRKTLFLLCRQSQEKGKYLTYKKLYSLLSSTHWFSSHSLFRARGFHLLLILFLHIRTPLYFGNPDSHSHLVILPSLKIIKYI